MIENALEEAGLDPYGITTGAWSVSRLLFALGDLHDTDGRPLGERRASSDAKRGCPMDLAPCPYDDERRNVAMNVSALEQVKRHLGSVHDDVSAFHNSLPEPLDPLDAMFMAVIDQLFSPALFVLGARERSEKVPALQATGHKLAAGLFAVMLGLLDAGARGEELPQSTDELMAFVKRTGALLGAGGVEACAGPPKLIRRTTAVFFGEDVHASARVSPTRVAVAQDTLAQIRFGLVLRMLDELLERRLIRAMDGAVTARNPFIRSLLDGRRRELELAPPPPELTTLVAMLPRDETNDARARLCQLALRLDEEPVASPIALRFATWIDARRGALVAEPHASAKLAALTQQAVQLRRSWLDPLCSLELRMRAALECERSAPLRFSSLVLPRSRCFPWFTALSSMQISIPIEPNPHVVFRDPAGHIAPLVVEGPSG